MFVAVENCVHLFIMNAKKYLQGIREMNSGERKT